MKRVCLHRRPEVIGVYADYQLVDLEVIWAADEGAVGVLFSFEVAWVKISIYISRENG